MQQLSILIATSALAVSAPVHAFSVGSDPACTHTSIQAAIDAAAANGPGLDLINIASNQIYAGQSLVVDGQTIGLRGGYSNCSSLQPTPGQRAIIDGKGNGGRPIIRFDNPRDQSSDLQLNDLELTGGQVAVGEGGALRAEGNLRIFLDGVRVRSNSASRGGGIYLKGRSESENAFLFTSEEGAGGNASLVEANQAGEGGGLFGDVWSNLQMADLRITDNQAERGGGMYLSGSATQAYAFVSATSISGGGVHSNQATQDGGGIYLTDGARFSTQRYAGFREFELRGNSAGRHGGGAFAGNGSTLRLLKGSAVDNHAGTLEAGNGGGLYVTAGASALVDGGDPVDGHNSACAAELPCAALSGNTAGSAGHGGRGGGAYTDFDGTINLQFAAVMDNRADDGAAAWVGAGFTNSAITLRSILMTGNESPGAMVVAEGASLSMYGSTLAGNPNTAALLRADGLGQLIVGSILYQPEIPIITTTVMAPSITTNCVIASSNFDPSGDVRVVDPMFVDPANHNFQVAFGSPAIDACPNLFTDSTLLFDYALRARGVDQPTVPDNDGPYDIGAFEMPVVPDSIFTDGFE